MRYGTSTQCGPLHSRQLLVTTGTQLWATKYVSGSVTFVRNYIVSPLRVCFSSLEVLAANLVLRLGRQLFCYLDG